MLIRSPAPCSYATRAPPTRRDLAPPLGHRAPPAHSLSLPLFPFSCSPLSTRTTTSFLHAVLLESIPAEMSCLDRAPGPLVAALLVTLSGVELRSPSPLVPSSRAPALPIKVPSSIEPGRCCSILPSPSRTPEATVQSYRHAIAAARRRPERLHPDDLRTATSSSATMPLSPRWQVAEHHAPVRSPFPSSFSPPSCSTFSSTLERAIAGQSTCSALSGCPRTLL
jgi:hypothetical protein